MSNTLNKHRHQYPPDWLVKLKNKFTSKKGEVTGTSRTRSEVKNANLNKPENPTYIDRFGNEFYNTGDGINEVDVNKTKKKRKGNNKRKNKKG